MRAVSEAGFDPAPKLLDGVTATPADADGRNLAAVGERPEKALRNPEQSCRCRMADKQRGIRVWPVRPGVSVRGHAGGKPVVTDPC